MSSASPPRVTIAVPLYRSARFVDTIVDNLTRADYPNLEILISDRHHGDDAIERLAERLGDDPRVRFLAATDGIGWVDHYNLLLREGRGTYFLWMPHDDVYPADYISRLVGALEADPRAILAFGRVEALDAEGRSLGWLDPPPLAPGAPWSAWARLRLVVSWNLGIPFRGVFRRDAVVAAGLHIRPLSGSVLADRYWVIGLALKAPLRYVPSCSNQKRFLAGSVHSAWPTRSSRGHWREASSVIRAYARAARPGPWWNRLGGLVVAGLFFARSIPGVQAARGWITRR